MGDEALYKRLLKELNPFQDDRVKHPWQPVDDVPSIQGVARSGLRDIYDEVELRCESQCVVLRGPRGSGLTHVIATLAQSLGVEGLLVYIDQITNPQKPFRSILHHLVSSLDERRGAGGPSALRRFACHIVATAMANVFEQEPPWKGRSLFQKVARSLRRKEDLVEDYLLNEKMREQVLRKVESYLQRLDKRLDVVFLDVLLRSLSSYHNAAARAWLSGHALGPRGKAALNVSSHIAGEEGAFAGLLSLGALAATYHPLVLVFDNVFHNSELIKGVGQAIIRLRTEVPALLIIISSPMEDWEQICQQEEIAQCFSESSFTLQGLDERAVQRLLISRLGEHVAEVESPWPCWPLPAEFTAKMGEEKLPCRKVLQGAAHLWRQLRQAGLHHSYAENETDDWDD